MANTRLSSGGRERLCGGSEVSPSQRQVNFKASVCSGKTVLGRYRTYLDLMDYQLYVLMTALLWRSWVYARYEVVDDVINFFLCNIGAPDSLV